MGFFSGCRNAKEWLEGWKNMTGKCMTTVDSGYVGCVGAVKYDLPPVVMTTEETQELYKASIQKIIDRWEVNKALNDPDVNWILAQESSFVGYSMNPFCEQFLPMDGEFDPADLPPLEGPEMSGSFENIF